MTISDEENRIRRARRIVNLSYRRLFNLTKLGRLKEAYETSMYLTGSLRALALIPNPPKSKRKK